MSFIMIAYIVSTFMRGDGYALFKDLAYEFDFEAHSVGYDIADWVVAVSLASVFE